VTSDENRTLTQVGAGTPMGMLLRRYWHTIAAVAELEDRPVKAVRLLGEDLALYRDRAGRYGLLDRHCAHRRADLESLWQALAEESWALVRRLGHDMKGSGRLYGLPRISAIGARIEAAAAGNERCEAALALAALESYLARAARSLFEPAPLSAEAGLSATRSASD